MVTKADASEEAKTYPGYWCVVCGRFLPEDEYGVVVHDGVPHPAGMCFDDDKTPQ